MPNGDSWRPKWLRYMATSGDAAQEGLLQAVGAVLRAATGRRAGVGDAAVMQDGHAVAQLVDVGQRVRREEHGGATVAQAQQLALEQRAGLRVESAHRLVEHVDLLAR